MNIEASQKLRSKRRLAVYTAIVGGYDQELEIEVESKDWDFILFADSKVKVHSCFVCQGLPSEALDPDPTRVARYIKTHPHTLLPEYDATLWIDGNVVLKAGQLEVLISDYLQSGVEAAFRPHPERSSIGEELLACHERKKDSFAAMYKQVFGYGRDGYRDNMGLVETNVIYRSNRSRRVCLFNEIWWSEIKGGSRRDQLSVMPSIKKSGVDFRLIPESTDIRDPLNSLYCLKPHQAAILGADSAVDPSALGTPDPLSFNRRSSEKLVVPGAVKNGFLLLTEMGQIASGVRLLEKLCQSGYRQKVRSYAAFYLAMHYIHIHREEEALSLLEEQMQSSRVPQNLVPLIEFLVSEISIKAPRHESPSLLDGALPSIDSIVQCLHAYHDGDDRLNLINKIFSNQGLCKVRLLRGQASLMDSLVPESTPRGSGRSARRALVTVIMPCYNVESVIETSMCSILDQTWWNLEIIAIDDCSDDETYSKLLDLSRLDARIKVMKTKKNSGPYVARNIALSSAHGDLITVCDADDWSHPQKIEIQARHLLSHPRLKGNTTCWLRTDDQLVPERRPYQPFYIQINISSLMIRRSVLVDHLCGWDQVRFSADSELYKRIQRQYSRRSIHNLDVVVSISRVRKNSLTHDSVTGYPGYVYGARKEYLESYSLYHSSKKPNFYYDGRQRRAFAVPRLMRPDQIPGSTCRFDLILAGDFRQDSHARLAISRLLTSLVRREKVGLLNLCSPMVAPGSAVSPKLRKWLARLNNPLLTYGENAYATRMVVVDASCLESHQAFLPKINAPKILLLIKSTEHKDSLDLSALYSGIQRFCSGTPLLEVGQVRRRSRSFEVVNELLGRLFWRCMKLRPPF